MNKDSNIKEIKFSPNYVAEEQNNSEEDNTENRNNEEVINNNNAPANPDNNNQSENSNNDNELKNIVDNNKEPATPDNNNESENSNNINEAENPNNNNEEANIKNEAEELENKKEEIEGDNIKKITLGNKPSYNNNDDGNIIFGNNENINKFLSNAKSKENFDDWAERTYPDYITVQYIYNKWSVYNTISQKDMKVLNVLFDKYSEET
jgi:hypothetical protein